MSDPDPKPSDQKQHTSPTLSILSRLFAVLCAILLLLLLYRFAKTFWITYTRHSPTSPLRNRRNRRRRPIFPLPLNLQKDSTAYRAVDVEERWSDSDDEDGSERDAGEGRRGRRSVEDEGYHDSESLASLSPRWPGIAQGKKLPDKPLPPLPGS